jgi:hypothetical protein
LSSGSVAVRLFLREMRASSIIAIEVVIERRGGMKCRLSG